MENFKVLPESASLYYDLKIFSDNETSGIFHGFFGRQGGQSKGVYSSLNCGFGSDDDPENVRANRNLIAAEIGTAPENILTAYQEHSAKCIEVTEEWASAHAPKADAMVTKVPGLALGILTADCAPVLFYAENAGKPIIGAAHAGWRGALGGILEATVRGMEGLGARTGEIKACIGPCIDKRFYEVGPEFYEAFIKDADENEHFFGSARKEDHFMFDLPGYCASRLQKAGLSEVYIKDIDTYFNENDLFSCRRAFHRKESDYGRQLSVIMINPGGA